MRLILSIKSADVNNTFDASVYIATYIFISKLSKHNRAASAKKERIHKRTQFPDLSYHISISRKIDNRGTMPCHLVRSGMLQMAGSSQI